MRTKVGFTLAEILITIGIIGVVAAIDDGEAGTVQRTREQLINGPSTYNYQCSKKGRGIWCGALIQKDGWKISKDYPW